MVNRGFKMLNVIFQSSNEFSSFLLITLISLLENNQKDFDCINIFVIDDGITETNKDKIFRLSEKYNCKITFIKLNFEHLMDGLIPLQGNSFTSYGRLFISSSLPNDIDKILYMDCDSLVLGSFKELWDMDIDDYYCAGVLDVFGENVRKRFWYLDVNDYINAGFLLINLKKWREDVVEEKFIKFISDNYGKFYVADQGIINLVFKDKIKIVEPKYNLLGYFQYLDYELANNFFGMDNEYYTKEIVDDSRKNPVFLHFIGFRGYPSPLHCRYHKYNPQYREYAKMANCENVIKYFKPPTPLASMPLKCENNKLIKFFLKLIPKRILVYYKSKEFIDTLEILSKQGLVD